MIDATTRVPQFEPWLTHEEAMALARCVQDNWITAGPRVKELEQALRECCGTRHAVACCNGTMALFMALKATGIGPGDRVIVPDFTFIASANAVMLTGAEPVFCDVKEDTLTLDVEAAEKAWNIAVKAIMPVHLYGQSCDMDKIRGFAAAYGLIVVEDAAQGIGVSWKGKPVGGLGHAGCLSFYADKTITTGEGGAVVTNDDEIADSCLRLSHQGNRSKGQYIHETIGYNFRMTDLQAAVGLVQMAKLRDIIDIKRRNYEKYRDGLAGVNTVRWVTVDEKSDWVPFRVIVMVDNPAGLQDGLQARGIETRRLFYPLHKQPCYQYLKANDARFPVANRIYDTGLALPSSVKLSGTQIDYVCSSIKEVLCQLAS